MNRNIEEITKLIVEDENKQAILNAYKGLVNSREKIKLEANKIVTGKMNIKDILIKIMLEDPNQTDLDRIIEEVKEAYEEVLKIRYERFYGEERTITLFEEEN